MKERERNREGGKERKKSINSIRYDMFIYFQFCIFFILPLVVVSSAIYIFIIRLPFLLDANLLINIKSSNKLTFQLNNRSFT